MAEKRRSDDEHSVQCNIETKCKFRRVTISEEEPTKHDSDALRHIKDCLALRNKWMHQYSCTDDPVVDKSEDNSAIGGTSLIFMEGVAHISHVGDTTKDMATLREKFAFQSFVEDYQLVRKIIYTGTVKTYAHARLGLLTAKFNLHTMLNSEKEYAAQKAVSHRDIYNVHKVDTHVHHSCCMNQKHLLKFIKRKLRHHADDVVTHQDGKPLTLGQVFETYKLTAYDLSLDTMDMHAHDTFERFDKFNGKFNPLGKLEITI